MLPNRIFFTGVPGSKWSGIAQIIEDNVPGMNTSDRSEERQYKHEQFTGHKGVYFGSGMEFPANLKLIDFAHQTLDGCRIIKSHEWPYKLEAIRKEYPDDWIMLIYRSDWESFNWWKKAGGFDITYPSYESYVDDDTMLKAISEQNTKMVSYAIMNNYTWQPFNKQFMKDIFDVELDIDYSKWSGIYISIIK